jgi:hypothetical protein
MSLEMLGAEWMGDDFLEQLKSGWGQVHETIMPIAQQVPIVKEFVPAADVLYTAATGQKTGARAPTTEQLKKVEEQKKEVTKQAEAQKQLAQVQQSAVGKLLLYGIGGLAVLGLFGLILAKVLR